MMTYLLIGIFFAFLVDLLIDYLKRIGVQQRRWSNIERFFCVLIWPFGLIVFLISFIKTIFKTKKDE